MRIVFLILASITFLSLEAQEYLPANSMNFTGLHPFQNHQSYNDSSYQNKNWYLSKYAGVTVGFGFFHGVPGTVLAAPFGMQLNHPLSNNLVTFVGITAAPTFFYSTQSFTNSAHHNSYPGGILYNPYSFGINPRIEMGLMYINDAKTFSISGSIGVEKTSYPSYPLDHPKTIQK